MAYPTGVNFKLVSPIIGAQPIHETSATKKHELGTVVRANDVTYGEGQFIYLLGAASTAQGDLCFYDGKTGATVRSVHAGTGSNGPGGVAASANVASQYGWYQIGGSAPVKAATVLANTSLYLTSTAGQVDDLVVSGDLVDGLVATAATVSGFATCQLNFPNVMGLGGASGSNSGDVTLGAIGSSANANGASLSGQVLTLQPASASFGGILTTGAQTIAGTKAIALGTSSTVPAAIPTSYGSGTGITLVGQGLLPQIGWFKVTYDYTVFVAAALTQDNNVCQIAARTRIMSAFMDVTVAFAGLAGTIQLTLSTTAGGGQLIQAFDAKTATVFRGDADGELGSALARATAVNAGSMPSATSATDISVRLTSGTGNIGDGAVPTLSAGSVTIYLKLEVLP